VGLQSCTVYPAHRPTGAAPVEPETVAGGPNHDYSLAEARRNFAGNLTAYRPADIDFERERGATSIKREIVKAYERAARSIEDSQTSVEDLVKSGELQELPGVGKAIAQIGCGERGGNEQERDEQTHRANIPNRAMQ